MYHLDNQVVLNAFRLIYISTFCIEYIRYIDNWNFILYDWAWWILTQLLIDLECIEYLGCHDSDLSCPAGAMEPNYMLGLLLFACFIHTFVESPDMQHVLCHYYLTGISQTVSLSIRMKTTKCTASGTIQGKKFRNR